MVAEPLLVNRMLSAPVRATSFRNACLQRELELTPN
jgi:hypothetical protein